MPNSRPHPKTQHEEANMENSKEQLISDFRALIADAEALIEATAGNGNDSVKSIRAQAADSLASAKINLADAQEKLVEKAKDIADNADDYIHKKPWEAIGVAAGIGLLIGLLVGRR